MLFKISRTLASFCLAVLVRGAAVTSDDCSAFSTDGRAASHYQYYRFYDFRNTSAPIPKSKSTKYPRSKAVYDDSWKDDWYIRDYPRVSSQETLLPVNFIPERVTDNSKDYSTYLTLSTARIDEENQEAGEITFTEFNASFASARFYGRVRGAPGAVASIFTYYNDTQEADIEIFTRAPSDTVLYSNQPIAVGDDYIYIPGAMTNVTTTKAQAYDDWQIHRLDWIDGRTVVFIDDKEVNTSTVNVPVANPPSRIYLDMWSNGGNWTGNMTIGNSAVMDIQWIEMLFNSTDSWAAPATNKKVCAASAVHSTAVKKGDGTRTVRSAETMLLLSFLLFISFLFI
ncbi:concanavalin A-like lectin/glucanase [Tothia fuscella]|uniref:Concanavalin A-like lectin/glucanase n=1 Tax=Tothia fuscella TaxID=1048955 RepID=A0A9P4NUP1_9PEZI|nr:concanavalin A-like lectin/glucanase [Tothia fuscella]